MDDVFSLEVSSGCFNSSADRSAADFVALLLYFWSAFSAYSAGDTAAEYQPGIGGVDDGLGVHLGDVTFSQNKQSVVDFSFQTYLRPKNQKNKMNYYISLSSILAGLSAIALANLPIQFDILSSLSDSVTGIELSPCDSSASITYCRVIFSTAQPG